jgi:hypothetical protein
MDSRISKLSGIRKDRIRPALQGMVDKGLFDVAPHKWLDNTYTIPAGFFDGESTPRFFAPSAPLNGDTPHSMGDFHHSAGTYRDLPLQRSTSTDTYNDDQPSEPVCDCDLNPVTEIKKPDAVDDATYVALLPALRKLPNSKALDVLALLSAAILDNSIKTTPIRMGGALIKAANAGNLDTSRLQTYAPTAQTCTPALSHQKTETAAEAKRRATFAAQAERSHLEMMARLSGVPLETLMGGAA